MSLQNSSHEMKRNMLFSQELKKTWKGLVVLNGRVRHPQTQGLVECGNRTLQMALGKWMQRNHIDHWSIGKYIFMLITSHHFHYSCF